MGITLLEDIEPSELSGGVKREGVWGIYLADTLDNGSGYARKYAAPEEFERLVGYVESVLFREYLVQDEHSVPCISSCHKCLRNYENRMVHSSLDWRLAVDLLHVYLGGHPDKIYMDEHWQSVFLRAHQLLQNLVRTEVVDVRTDQGMVFQFEMKRRRTGLLMRHPLLPPGLDERRALRETKSTLGLDRISSINPFFLLRDPVGELTRASESMLS